MKRFVLILAVFTLMIGGCAQKSAQKGSPKSTTMHFVLCPKSLNNPYWNLVEQGMKAKAKELGVDARFVAPVEADAAKQVSMIESVVASGVDGIAISPNDPSSVISVIKSARSKNIPTIAFDADSPKSNRMCYVGTDNFAAGKAAGEQMIKALGGKGKVVIITGGLAALNLNQRVEGFKEAIKAAPGITVIGDPLPCNDDQATAQRLIEDSLQANKDLAGIFAVGLWAGIPAGNVLKNQGKIGKVKVVTFDVLDSELKLVKEGAIQALIGQRPYEMGQKSVEVLYNLAKGGKPEADIIPTGIDLVTKDNVDQFMKK